MLFATQLQRPNTPSILGSNTPLKRNSSPKIVLNIACTMNKAKNHQAPTSPFRTSCDPKNASKLRPSGSVRNGKTETQAFSNGVLSTSSFTATATMNGTTHKKSLARGWPVAGSRGTLSLSLRLTVAQCRSPSSLLTMIMESTNNHTNPSAISTNNVTPNARGSESKSSASSGKTIQLRMPIGAAASAQIPRIFAGEYCSLIDFLPWRYP